MTTETEDILWIAAQQDRIMPRELIIFAEQAKKTLHDLMQMEESDFTGIDKKILNPFLDQREKLPYQVYQKIYDVMQKEGIDTITYTDPLFPAGLKKLSGKGIPVMLYHQGRRIQFANCIAMVGTRNCSTHAVEITRHVSRDLAKLGYVIVTGLARGIDAAAHRGAISVKGKTVGVLPWIHEPYPPEHTRLMHETKENGCIISEHFFQSPKYDRYKFLQRNAVISGISELLIAVESSFTGGTRWQVELAISQKKPVIAIEPEKSNTQAYDGYLKFLEKGAIGASTHEDVLEIVRNKVQLLEQVVGEELESSSMMKMGYSAIMNAFRALELHITELAAVRGLASPFEIEQAIQFLVKTGLLNRSDKEKFESIRNLRNAYLHSNNLVSVGDVKSFLDTAEKLDMKLEDALLRGRIDKFL